MDERSRLNLYERLNEVIRPPESDHLMELLPPVGWADVATKEDVRHSQAMVLAEIKAVDTRLGSKIDGVDTRLTGQIRDLETRLTAKIDAVDMRLTARIEGLDAKIDGVDAHLTTKIEALNDTMNTRFDLVAVEIAASADRLRAELLTMMDVARRTIFFTVVGALVAAVFGTLAVTLPLIWLV